MGFIAVLFEYVFGLRPDIPNKKLVWDVRLIEEHGVIKYPFGGNGLLDLKCERRNSINERPVIKVKSNISLSMIINWEGHEDIKLEITGEELEN